VDFSVDFIATIQKTSALQNSSFYCFSYVLTGKSVRWTWYINATSGANTASRSSRVGQAYRNVFTTLVT